MKAYSMDFSYYGAIVVIADSEARALELIKAERPDRVIDESKLVVHDLVPGTVVVNNFGDS